jgi:hypothetical protein
MWHNRITLDVLSLGISLCCDTDNEILFTWQVLGNSNKAHLSSITLSRLLPLAPFLADKELPRITLHSISIMRGYMSLGTSYIGVVHQLYSTNPLTSADALDRQVSFLQDN